MATDGTLGVEPEPINRLSHSHTHTHTHTQNTPQYSLTRSLKPVLAGNSPEPN